VTGEQVKKAAGRAPENRDRTPGSRIGRRKTDRAPENGAANSEKDAAPAGRLSAGGRGREVPR